MTYIYLTVALELLYVCNRCYNKNFSIVQTGDVDSEPKRRCARSASWGSADTLKLVRLYLNILFLFLYS